MFEDKSLHCLTDPENLTETKQAQLLLIPKVNEFTLITLLRDLDLPLSYSQLKRNQQLLGSKWEMGGGLEKVWSVLIGGKVLDKEDRWHEETLPQFIRFNLW